MTAFIELTKKSGELVTLNTSEIKRIEPSGRIVPASMFEMKKEEDGGSRITTGADWGSDMTFVYVRESYHDILTKLERLAKIEWNPTL